MNELADEIWEFLDQHARTTPNYDPEWDPPDAKYTSPDASEMWVAAKMLERGKVPDVPHSSWNSGGYEPYGDDEAEEWHDSIMDRIKQIQ